MWTRIKQRLAGYLTWHVVNPVRRMQAEQIYQGLFAQQCANLGIRNDFYPVGAAASHGLMYLLARILAEQPVESVLEFGSGQSTLLIDRLARPGREHVCYEEDAAWHAQLAPRLRSCDYRLRPLVREAIDSVAADTYGSVAAQDFDLLLVDGPRGVDRYSRLGCVSAVRANRKSDFVVVLDDADRVGEQDTLGVLKRDLERRGLPYRLAFLEARSTQAVLAVGRFAPVTWYF
jgi:predicted O-methyltransferase YrrM